MKILCVIDSLGSGGAQRQLVSLAVGLKKRGHQIRFMVYNKGDHFFLSLLQAAKIHCQVIPPCSYVQRTLVIRRILRQSWQDVVLAFLEAPSLYAELARIPKQRWGLVVGERSANPGIKNYRVSWIRQFHRLADVVVCNSHTNKLMLETLFPFLGGKLCTIYNSVDFELFRPTDNVNAVGFGRATEFRIVVVASYQENKNMMNLAKALLIIKNWQNKQSIVVDWFGAMPAGPKAFNDVERFVVENGLSESFLFHAATHDIINEFLHADVIGLFSFYEGLPNVVCEGMACGKPILLSNVCDASNLVQHGKNGFLCDPASPDDIAEKILSLVALSEFERKQMGLESRKIAEQLFAEEVVIEWYERIFIMATDNTSLPADCSWPAHVPESAVLTVERW